jgi:hypothetical protein
MAHLWVNDEVPGWAVFPLDHEAFCLDTIPPSRLGQRTTGAMLTRIAGEEGISWCLLCAASADVRVNGVPLSEGIRMLANQDEIRVVGVGTVFFSTERRPRVEPFAGRPTAGLCPRCLLEIESGALAVGCPACGALHHQTVERNCWTYADTCALCPQSTALDGTYRWTPEGI